MPEKNLRSHYVREKKIMHASKQQKIYTPPPEISNGPPLTN